MEVPYSLQEESPALHRRIYGLLVMIVLVLAALLARAWYLQVVQGQYYHELSENNRVRIVPVAPPRGLIYDRHGTLLVNNSPSFNLYVVTADMPNPEVSLSRLAHFIGMNPVDLSRFVTSKKSDPYFPVKVKSDLSLSEVAKIEGSRLELPGVTIEPEFKRNAIHHALAVHLLGYVGEISQEQVDSGVYKGAQQGDLVGQYGVEQVYDSIIRGIPGQKGVEVDAMGHEIRLLRAIEPVRGKDLYLTLDLNLQKVAEEVMADKAGAIVAMDPRSGEILAMVSHPDFDPNVLSRRASSVEWQALMTDKARPLTNRAIQGQYPPGSTFKIILGVALLETKTATPFNHVECRGQYPFGNRTFRDWKKQGHGSVALHRALVESCDVYFYEMGNRLGVDTIAKFSGDFGLGQPTGIALASERGGLIPSTAWKRRVRKEPWYPGETLSVAIGQGYVSVTPLQMAGMISAVAQGVWHTPQVLKKIRDDKTGHVEEMPPSVGRPIPVSPEAIQFIRGALGGAVAEPSGTAYKSRSEFIPIAGKTGTAQVVAIPDKGDRRKAPEGFNDHAWFVAFAPVVDPTIAVAVLVEHGGHGGSASAPLAKRVIERYFNVPSEAPQTKGVAVSEGPQTRG